MNLAYPVHLRRAPIAMAALAVTATVALAACSGSAAVATSTASVAPASTPVAAPSAAASPPAVASVPPAPSESPAPSSAEPAASALPSAVPTSIDPCQLVTADEAGTLASASFGPGKEEKLSGNSRMCVYGGNTTNVFEVIVAVAPDEATARKAEASAEADAKSNAAQLQQGLAITKLADLATGTDAVLMALKPNVLGIDGRGIYVLRGTVFFAIDDLVRGGKAPSADAMKSAALAVLGKLP